MDRDSSKHSWQDAVTLGVLVGGMALIGIILFLKSPLRSSFSSNPANSSNSNTSQSSQSAPAPPQSQSELSKQETFNPFNQEQYPKASCGDRMPTNSSDFPVDFYPVYVSNNDRNLNLITNQLCGDAYRLIRKKTGQPVIQVASFTNRQRAEQFRDFLRKRVGDSDIGEPQRWNSPSSQASDSETQSDGWIRIGAVKNTSGNAMPGEPLIATTQPVTISPTVVPQKGDQVVSITGVNLREGFPQAPDYKLKKQVSVLSANQSLKILDIKTFVDTNSQSPHTIVWAKVKLQ